MKFLRDRELTYIGNDAEITAAMMYDDLLVDFEAAVPELETLQDVLMAERNGFDHAYHDYDTLSSGAAADGVAAETERDDLALMRYTSGTTGRSKGALHTHRQLLTSADSYAHDCVEPTSEDLFGALTRPARTCLGQSIDSIRL